MPFSPQVTQLSSGSSVRTFVDTETGIIYNADPVQRRVMFSTKTAIAKNAVFTYTTFDDLILLGTYLIATASTIGTVKIEVFNVLGEKIFSTTVSNYSSVTGYIPFLMALFVPKNGKITITPSEQIDKLTVVAEKIFIEQASI
jgi:hypothetical protein